jgi:molecular chaperone IbpA
MRQGGSGRYTALSFPKHPDLETSKIHAHLEFVPAIPAARIRGSAPWRTSSLHVASDGGYAMRQFDLAPLYRNTIGFDRLFSMLDQHVSVDAAPTYPPYNIERTGENAYRISVAVAGFTDQDLAIEVKENALSVRGEKKVSDERKAEVLYQGIAARTFERRFQLADGVQVTGAALENGLLHIDLVRQIPEAKKPKLIPIESRAAQTIEAKQAA